MQILATLICFVVCHAGPVDHFLPFSKALAERGHEVKILASGPAASKLERYGAEYDTIEGESAEDVALKCADASVVVTDVGHLFALHLQEALPTRHYSYYDNPEPYIPGGYSEVAAQVMEASEKVLFANANLAETMDLSVPCEGIGFYPRQQVEKVKQLREQPNRRERFFAKWGVVDLGQKVLVYFGGNNETYFDEAFPAFLSILRESSLSNVIIVLQQHPGAEKENFDKVVFEKEEMPFPLIVSDFNSSEIQAVADIALYYQTSMGPQFILSGIPTIQVGHKRYDDVLVRNGLAPSVSNVEEFFDAINTAECVDQEILFEKLGLKEEWYDRLEESLFH